MRLVTPIVLALISVFAPLQAIVFSIMGLTVVDLITGLLASKKMGAPITSSGLKRTIIKVAVYEVAVLLAYVVGLYLTGPEVPVEKILAGFVGITELKSCLENMDIILGGSMFEILISRLQNIASGKSDGQ